MASNSFPTYGEIDVYIIDGISGPVMYVDEPVFKVNGKANNWKKGDAGVIKWRLKDETTFGKAGDPDSNRDNWRLACIEFEDDGAVEFEEHKANADWIHVIDKFDRTGPFKYTIWAVPRNGFGSPLALDPIIENEPK